MATSYNRQINLYINGKQVSNDLKSIRDEMARLGNEQARMTIGSDEYIRHTQGIRQLRGDDRRAQLTNSCGVKVLEHDKDWG